MCSMLMFLLYYLCICSDSTKSEKKVHTHLCKNIFTFIYMLGLFYIHVHLKPFLLFTIKRTECCNKFKRNREIIKLNVVGNYSVQLSALQEVTPHIQGLYFKILHYGACGFPSSKGSF